MGRRFAKTLRVQRGGGGAEKVVWEGRVQAGKKRGGHAGELIRVGVKKGGVEGRRAVLGTKEGVGAQCEGRSSRKVCGSVFRG